MDRADNKAFALFLNEIWSQREGNYSNGVSRRAAKTQKSTCWPHNLSRARCHLSLTKWECNEHPVVACHVVIIPAQKAVQFPYKRMNEPTNERVGAACRWEALRDMTIAAFRVPRRHSWQSGSALLRMRGGP